MQPGIRQINVELEKDDWLRNIEYGDGSNKDGEDLMDISGGGLPVPGESKPFVEALRLLHRPRIDPNGYHLDFFNFSNDHLYERLKPRKITLRQTGTIELKHAGPATKLQMPFVSALIQHTRYIPGAQLYCPLYSTSSTCHAKKCSTGIDILSSFRQEYLCGLRNWFLPVELNSSGKQSRQCRDKARRWKSKSLKRRRIYQ